MTISNPYESPQTVEPSILVAADAAHLSKEQFYTAWTIIFLSNTILPGVIGWTMTNNTAKVGAVCAALILFGFGIWICMKVPMNAQITNRGGIIVGLLQFIPFLQFICGIVGLMVADIMGQVIHNNDGPQDGTINSMLGGFAATFVTGGLLIFASFVVGLLIQSIRKPKLESVPY